MVNEIIISTGLEACKMILVFAVLGMVVAYGRTIRS